MATRRLLQAASHRLRLRGARSGGSGRAASDDARIVERATRGQVEMRQFGIESLGGAGMHAPHVAIFGASVKDPTRECFLSIPTVVGVQGAETVLEIRPHLNYAEAQKYDATADTLEHMCAQLPPVGFSRTDALDAGAARKGAYEEAA